ncbi:MAG: hypothetical protein DHS20C21_24070 [Gemmatimonadota bacterium]|nr:MAG: hypothetical protein DHS20C21_24070 [Gemmatimonadota bacterium]
MDEITTPPPDSVEPDDLPTAMQRRARQVGHDLNNAIGVVSGRAELALIHIQRGNAEGAEKGLQVILEQIERMQALSASLRELNRP